MTDPFHAAAIETHDALVAAGLDVDVIPEPNHRRVRSYDFVASYANFYVCNGAVIAAQFGDTETDKLAENALKRHFPGREGRRAYRKERSPKAFAKKSRTKKKMTETVVPQ